MTTSIATPDQAQITTQPIRYWSNVQLIERAARALEWATMSKGRHESAWMMSERALADYIRACSAECRERGLLDAVKAEMRI